MRNILIGLLFVAGLAGCGGGGGGGTTTAVPTAAPTSAAPLSATFTVTLGATATTAALPKVGTFGGGTITVPAATQGAGNTLSLTESVGSGASALARARQAVAKRGTAATIQSALLSISATTAAASQLYSQPGFTIVLPTVADPTTQQFWISYFDPSNAAGTNALIGPGTYANGAVTFQTGSSALTFTAGESYLFVLFAIPGTSPTPGPSPSTGSGSVRDYVIPNVTSLSDITVGPDANLWFAGALESGGGSSSEAVVGTISTSGVIGEHAVPAAQKAWTLRSAPDNRLWFTTQSSNVCAMTTGGVATCYTTPAATTLGLVVGPDGNIWVGDDSSNAINILSTSGTLVSTIPQSDQTYGGQMAVLGGNVWMADQAPTVNGASEVRRITTSGSISTYAFPSPPGHIIAGSSGNLWVGEFQGSNVDSVTSSGTVTQNFVAQNADIYGLCLAPDGSLWATEILGGVDHLSASGTVIARYTLPSADVGTMSCAVGPDGNIYIAIQTGRIAVLTP